MTINTKCFSIVSAAALVLASSVSAQSVSRSIGYARSYGDSDAGVVVNARGTFAAKRTSTLRYLWGYFRHEVLTARATGNVYANLRFLGSYKRAGTFSVSVNAKKDIFRKTNGRYISSACSHNGRTFLQVGTSVLWNRSLPRIFGASTNLQVRLVSPTIYLPMPAGGVMRIKGSAYGRVRGSIGLVLDACRAKVLMNGYVAVSGHGNVSVSAWSLLFNASVSASFYAQEQKLEASLSVQPGISTGSNWGKLGSLRLRSGAMRGYIKLRAVLPPYIPISFTIANWRKGATTKTLL